MREADLGDYISRQEQFVRQISENERFVIRGLVAGLDAKKYDGLCGVHWAMFLAGDFADSFEHPQVKPESVDLRIAIDAQRRSEEQRVCLERVEKAVIEHLESAEFPYMQRSGDNWHMVRMSFDKDSHVYKMHPDTTHNNIRFTIIPDGDLNRRRIDLIINRFRGKDIDAQIRWEEKERQREPIILFDSKHPKSCIL